MSPETLAAERFSRDFGISESPAPDVDLPEIDDLRDEYLSRAQTGSLQVIDKPTERRLFAGVRTGEPEATRRLLESHVGLVAFMAESYRGNGHSDDELLDEGGRILVESIRKFAPVNGDRFVDDVCVRLDDGLAEFSHPTVKPLAQASNVRIPTLPNLEARWAWLHEAISDWPIED